MRILDISDERFDTALELFSQGISFSFNKVDFYLDKNTNVLSVSSTSNWRLKNLDNTKALMELERVKTTFDFIKFNRPAFADLIQGVCTRFSLVSDYGTGTVEVCHLEDNKLIWN